jgi:hypothetical protein
MDTNYLHEIARIGLHLLSVVIVTLITFYLPRVMRAIERRIGLDIPDRLELEAQRIAVDAIYRAEEFARDFARRQGEGAPGAEKLAKAAEYFRDHASPAILKYIGTRVPEYLEAKLGQLRTAPALSAASVAIPVENPSAQATGLVPVGPPVPGPR